MPHYDTISGSQAKREEDEINLVAMNILCYFVEKI